MGTVGSLASLFVLAFVLGLPGGLLSSWLFGLVGFVVAVWTGTLAFIGFFGSLGL